MAFESIGVDNGDVDMEMTDEVLDTEVPVSDTLVQAEMQSAE